MRTCDDHQHEYVILNGVNQGCVYDAIADSWTAQPLMNHGRWYPSALTLSDGSSLCISGQYKDKETDSTSKNNNAPQIWRNTAWIPVSMESDAIYEAFPQLHLDSKGQVFIAGPLAQSKLLDANNPGMIDAWKKGLPSRQAGFTDYGPSVKYDQDKVMSIGGGIPPRDITETIDLTKPAAWEKYYLTALFWLRGGTSGSAGNEFNDLTPGRPVHRAELWNPKTKTWTVMAEEDANRCYHSIALLLPNGSILSAGGGEGDNAPPQTDAQIYKPPYLCQGIPGPSILKAPSNIEYGTDFDVTMKTSETIKTVSWVRLGSVTHSTNMNQSLIFLAFKPQSTSTTKVTVTAPAGPTVAPPGHYMLFLLNQQGVPAVAPIIRIKSKSIPVNARALAASRAGQPISPPEQIESSLPALNEKIMAERSTPPVIIGLTSACPYGLGPCWAGAYDALKRINDIAVVRPIPDQANSLAFVYLHRDILPDIDNWRKEFEATANSSYHMRGIELKLTGAVTKTHDGADEQLTMAGTATRPEVALTPYEAKSNINWDFEERATRPITDLEAGAYERLQKLLADHPGCVTIRATGTMQKHGENRFSLDIRDFTVV